MLPRHATKYTTTTGTRRTSFDTFITLATKTRTTTDALEERYPELRALQERSHTFGTTPITTIGLNSRPNHDPSAEAATGKPTTGTCTCSADAAVMGTPATAICKYGAGRSPPPEPSSASPSP
eukprot:scaffold38162_cov48-Phaeocystis_antarctica.AAC.2